mmetsp:Transcript_65246/g.187890  ORF Transcript_65246/g.187890 Transcript_65246/m.187890 type:complete len:339 (-) Transcript_65246:204-1220(-)
MVAGRSGMAFGQARKGLSARRHRHARVVPLRAHLEESVDHLVLVGRMHLQHRQEVVDAHITTEVCQGVVDVGEPQRCVRRQELAQRIVAGGYDGSSSGPLLEEVAIDEALDAVEAGQHRLEVDAASRAPGQPIRAALLFLEREETGEVVVLVIQRWSVPLAMPLLRATTHGAAVLLRCAFSRTTADAESHRQEASEEDDAKQRRPGAAARCGATFVVLLHLPLRRRSFDFDRQNAAGCHLYLEGAGRRAGQRLAVNTLGDALNNSFGEGRRMCERLRRRQHRGLGAQWRDALGHHRAGRERHPHGLRGVGAQGDRDAAGQGVLQGLLQGRVRRQAGVV